MEEKVLYSFRAGRVQYDQATGAATPVRGQGRVVLKTSTEDPALRAVQWQPRASYLAMEPSVELMVVPGDVEFAHVPECRTGRVISMRFSSSGHRVLYWLQSPPQGNLDELTPEDRENIERLNELANEFPEEEDAEDADATADASTGADEDTEMAAEASHEGGDGAADAGAGAGVPAPRIPGPADDALAARAPGDAARAALAALRARVARQAPPVSLARALPPAALVQHIETASDAEIEQLLAYVGEVASTRAELVQVARSPHFAQTLGALTAALDQGGTQLVAQQSGVPYRGEGSEAFLRAVYEAEGRQAGDEESAAPGEPGEPGAGAGPSQ